MDKDFHGVGESLEPLVLRARLILLRSSRDAGGVGGPRAHASRIASTSAFSAAKFRSAVAAGDCSGPGATAGGDASDARGFVDAVDGASSLSFASRFSVLEGSMVMMIIRYLTTAAFTNEANVGYRKGF